MATKATVDRIMEGKPLTKPQQLRVLKDARKLLSDPEKWTTGHYIHVTNEDGDAAVNDDFMYVPSKHENVAMCVMGAVACAAGLQGKVTDDGVAARKLLSCSLGRTMVEALPSHCRASEEDIFETWVDSECWIGDVFKTSFDGFDGPGMVNFEEWLAVKKQTPLEWYNEYQEDIVLESVYEYNDGGTYEQVLALLDTAIDNLSKKDA